MDYSSNVPKASMKLHMSYNTVQLGIFYKKTNTILRDGRTEVSLKSLGGKTKIANSLRLWQQVGPIQICPSRNLCLQTCYFDIVFLRKPKV